LGVYIHSVITTTRENARRHYRQIVDSPEWNTVGGNLLLYLEANRTGINAFSLCDFIRCGDCFG
jgi:hypothetical protein